MAGGGHGTKAVVAALLANLGIAVAKFVGFVITGSASMLAEAIHSVADSGNQGLLLLGGHRARRQADEDAPVRLRPRALLLGLHRGAGAVQPRRRLRHLRGHREDPAPARDRVGRRGHRDPPVRHRPRDVLVPHRHRGVEQGARRRVVVAVHPPLQEPGAAGRAPRGPRRRGRPRSSRWAPSPRRSSPTTRSTTASARC